jgi:hypothetical protein
MKGLLGGVVQEKTIIMGPARFFLDRREIAVVEGVTIEKSTDVVEKRCDIFLGILDLYASNVSLRLTTNFAQSDLKTLQEIYTGATIADVLTTAGVKIGERLAWQFTPPKVGPLPAKKIEIVAPAPQTLEGFELYRYFRFSRCVLIGTSSYVLSRTDMTKHPVEFQILESVEDIIIFDAGKDQITAEAPHITF